MKIDFSAQAADLDESETLNRDVLFKKLSELIESLKCCRITFSTAQRLASINHQVNHQEDLSISTLLILISDIEELIADLERELEQEQAAEFSAHLAKMRSYCEAHTQPAALELESKAIQLQI